MFFKRLQSVFYCHKMSKRFCWTALFLTLAFFLLSAVSADTAAMQHVSATNGHNASVELPEVTEQVKRYSNLCYLLYFVSFAYGLVIRIAFLQSELNSLIRNRAESASLNPVFQFLVYYVCLYAVISLLMLPLSIYSDFVIEHQFNLSEQSFQSWSLDYAKGIAISFLFAVPTVGGYFWLARKFRRLWPIFFFLVVCTWSGFESFVSPFVEQVFNKFTVMEPGPLQSKIQMLAAKAGVPNVPILIADKSKQTKTFNASVSGIGGSARIVIWDTAAGNLPDDQILAIVGHELGHYCLHHEYTNYLIAVGINFLLIPINLFFLEPFAARLPKQWQVRDIRDFAFIPAIALFSSICFMLADPIYNGWSRMQEHQADAFSKRITGDGLALSRALITAYKNDLDNPDPPPFIQFWMCAHPSLKQRVEFALSDAKE